MERVMDIFITLDYELFLGKKTGTPENCLIRPMEALCSVADQIGFKYIIFVDAAYLLRLSQLKDKCPQLLADYDLVTNNIELLAEKGHDIQLHFHPQWLYSSYNNVSKEWDLDFQHYKLSDMEHDFAFESFRSAKQLLDDIVGYKTYAFRAGGYCLDSFSDSPRLFSENGICIDSSVARNLYENRAAHNFDYRRVPQSTEYKFSNNVTKESENGCFTELSISSIKVNFLQYLTKVRKLQKSYNPKVVYKDGFSINEAEKESYLNKLFGLLKGKVYLACIDGVGSTMLPLYMNYAIDNKCVLIGHPKNATDSSISIIKRHLKNNQNNICYKTTKDLSK